MGKISKIDKFFLNEAIDFYSYKIDACFDTNPFVDGTYSLEDLIYLRNVRKTLDALYEKAHEYENNPCPKNKNNFLKAFYNHEVNRYKNIHSKEYGTSKVLNDGGFNIHINGSIIIIKLIAEISQHNEVMASCFGPNVINLLTEMEQNPAILQPSNRNLLKSNPTLSLCRETEALAANIPIALLI